MPIETVTIVGAISAVFAVFTAVLAWTDRQTRGIKRR